MDALELECRVDVYEPAILNPPRSIKITHLPSGMIVEGKSKPGEYRKRRAELFAELATAILNQATAKGSPSP